MRKGIALAALGLLLGAAAVTAAITIGPGDGTASSHREAPLIADDPSADLTDLYAFRSPDRPNTVTIIANVIPGEDPAAGPNWYTFSPNARYNLKIDTTGDGNGDVTYRFEFKRKTGPYFLGDTAQPFTVTRVRGGKATVVARGTTPPNNIGPRSTPNYRQLTTKSIVSFDGGASKAFAGQRDDPFYGDIGAIFDLVAIRKGTGNQGGGKDFFAGYGVHTFAVQVPVAGLKGNDGVIGVWASVDRRKVTTRGGQTRNSGPVGAGQPAGQPAGQRGDHPHRSQGPVERPEPVARFAVPQVLRDAHPGRGDQPAVQAGRSGDGPRRPRRRAPHRRPEAQLHRDEDRRPAPAEPEHPGDREPEAARRPRRRQPGLAERPPARRRRDRHRRAGRGRLPQGNEAARSGTASTPTTRSCWAPSRTSRTRRAASRTRRASSGLARRGRSPT